MAVKGECCMCGTPMSVHFDEKHPKCAECIKHEVAEMFAATYAEMKDKEIVALLLEEHGESE